MCKGPCASCRAVLEGSVSEVVESILCFMGKCEHPDDKGEKLEGGEWAQRTPGRQVVVGHPGRGAPRGGPGVVRGHLGER